MVGPYSEYIVEYEEYFLLLKKLAEQGKKIVFIEGNHDFHFKEVIKKSFGAHLLSSFRYVEDSVVLKKNDTFFYFSHGDELDIKNKIYQKYKKIVRSSFTKFLVNYLVSYQYVLSWKEKLSKKSKDLQKDFKLDKSRKDYREYSDNQKLKDFDYIVCGHSHVLDSFRNRYFNNGFFPETKKFLFYNGTELKFVDLYKD